MVWGAIHHGGGVSWSWWMEPWTGISTSRSWGIKCCDGWRGCLDVTLCMSKTMPRPIHVTRQPFWNNSMLRSWTGQLGVHTWTQLSVFGIKCQSGSETWITSPSTVAELNNAVHQARAAVRPGRVRTLVKSMPRRVTALLAASGGHTHYWRRGQKGNIMFHQYVANCFNVPYWSLVLTPNVN